LNFLISSFRSGGSFENSSTAIFTQGTYDITDRWHLTVGLRWTEDEKSFLPDQEILTLNPDTAGFLSPPQQFIFQPGTPVLPSVEATITAEEFTPMVNLSYDFTEDLLVYGLYSQGFKSGGFTQRVLPPLIPGITCSAVPVECIPSFEPEFVDVFETGFRYASSDNRNRLSGAYFYTDYSDLQVSTFTSVAPVVSNAAAASIQGFELEWQFIPTDSLFIEASLGYTDASYDEIDAATQLDVSNDFERVSEWSGNLGVSYDFELGSWVITPRADWSYRSEYFNDAFNSPQISQDGFSLVDLNLAFVNDNGVSVTLAVKNATDEQYLATGVFGDAFSSYEGVYDRGRQAFVRLGYEF
ncbi:MAG: TonB-dependent receptor, partial [Hyphomonadaceae bacterium]|nr:TonB-dependent receptor [Hyphomonadaceae bacterium]